MANRMAVPTSNQQQSGGGQAPHQFHPQNQFTAQQQMNTQMSTAYASQVGSNPSAMIGRPTAGDAQAQLQQQQHFQMGQQLSPSKDPPVSVLMNTASLCRMGQEMVQDIVHKMMDIFQMQKHVSVLPNGVQPNIGVFLERHRSKLEELLNQSTSELKNLRLIYNKVTTSCGDVTDYGDMKLIPYEDQAAVRPIQSTEFQYANDELKEITEQVRLKNRQLKEIIDKLRSIVWEINTMMAMRYT